MEAIVETACKGPLQALKLELYLEEEELSHISDQDGEKLKEMLQSDVFQSAQSNFIPPPPPPQPREDQQFLDQLRGTRQEPEEQGVRESEIFEEPRAEIQEIFELEEEKQTRRHSTTRKIRESEMENQKLQFQQKSYIESLYGPHSTQVRGLDKLKFFISPLYLQKIVKSLLSVEENRRMVQSMIREWGFENSKEVEYEDHYEIEDFGTRLKEIENQILDLDKLPGAQNNQILRDAEKALRITEHNRKLLEISEESERLEDRKGAQQSQYFLLPGGSENGSSALRSNVLEEVLASQQISYYPDRMRPEAPNYPAISLTESQRILENSFFDVCKGQILSTPNAKKEIVLQSFKDHLSHNESQTMKLLNSLSESLFSVLLSNSFVILENEKSENEEQKKNKERFEKVQKVQGSMMVVPVKLVLMLAEHKI